MPALVPPEILKKLQVLAEESVTPEQRRERMDRGSTQQPFLRSSAIAKLATDPTVMWVLRQYLRTPAVSCGHVPSILTAYPLDDERYPGPQGWHSVRALCDFFQSQA